MKRIFDFLLAFFGIALFSPLGLFFAFLVKIEDGGSIFFIQERWGRRGKKFKTYKFRTMIPDADQRWGLKPAEESDFRVTRVGGFLRVTAMDELPQLINILKGDMSFVGPRALAVEELDPSIPGFSERHQIRPGLTGFAQVHTPRDASLHQKFQYDLCYVRHSTFWGDLQLLFLSFWISIRRKWESREKKI